MARVVVVTGGTKGIGFAIAKKFRQEGDFVYICGRDRNSLTRAIKEIGCIGYVCDVRNLTEIKRFLKRVYQKEKRLDVVVNNAGIYEEYNLKNFPYSKIKAVLDTNLTGVISFTKEALRYMKKGDVVIISSIAGYDAFWEGGSIYCATKTGLYGFAESIQKEFKDNIRVSLICPGYVLTPLWDKLEKLPQGTMLDPKDIAEVVYFAVKMPKNAALSIAVIRSKYELKYGW
ncbi:MAG: SDR family oxidoreductase [bacterium]|nr:SDR family oxidoreductase [bacterium]